MGSSGVHVAIFDMSAADKERLDTIEGVGAGYAEIRLEVPGFGECFSYAATESHIDDSLLPYDWYRELVLAGAATHGFPEGYVEQIRRIAVRSDPDVERRTQMHAIIDRISRA